MSNKKQQKQQKQRATAVSFGLGVLLMLAAAIIWLTAQPSNNTPDLPEPTLEPIHTATLYFDLSDHSNPTTQFLLGIDGPDDYTKITPQPAPSDWGLPDNFTK